MARSGRRRGVFSSLGAIVAASLAGCAADAPTKRPAPGADAVRAQIASLMPATVPDRAGWAVDIYAAFAALRIEPDAEAICSVLAVTEQESTYRADPTVPRLGKIARDEIERRAERAGVPKLLLDAALQMRSPDSRTYSERIDAARTEKELSELFEDFVDEVPLGRRLLAGYNPVRTGGPMQVSIEFAERHAKERPYPYRVTGSLREEVFSRRGGLYFGIAHLLDYAAPYDKAIFRFADFNAGVYASRNAAFQNAVTRASGVALELDGDLVRHGDPAQPSRTEAAVRSLGRRLDMTDGAIRQALEQEDRPGFEKTRLYARVFELAEQTTGQRPARAVIPAIRLQSPKITRPLTTEWFARRVDERYRRCLAKAGS